MFKWKIVLSTVIVISALSAILPSKASAGGGDLLRADFITYPPATLSPGQQFSYSFSCTNISSGTLTQAYGWFSLGGSQDPEPNKIMGVTGNSLAVVIEYFGGGNYDIYKNSNPNSKWWILNSGQQIVFSVTLQINPKTNASFLRVVAGCNHGDNDAPVGPEIIVNIVAPPAPPPVVINPAPTPVPPVASAPVITISESVSSSESTASDLPLYTESSPATIESSEEGQSLEEARSLSINLMLIPFGLIILIVLIVLLAYVRDKKKKN
ncbi:MAG: hypothetical protein JNK26_02085 [Candidatus Doudnabacteria bacterium]|nr:hypothetical protein [Candidatus Doudnabacteria bacterium]